MNKIRRRLLITIGAGPLMLPLRAFSVQQNQEKILQAIASNKQQAVALQQALVSMAADINDDTAAAFAGRETALRLNLYATLETVDDLMPYVTEDRRLLADDFCKEGVPLLPDKEAIKSEIRLGTAPSEECDETVFSVTIDIFLEGLGLHDFQEAIKEVLRKSPAVQSKVDALAKAVQLRDWEQAIDLVSAVMDQMSHVKMFDLLIEILGREKGRAVWRAILRKLGLRFVPIVGQVYTVIAVGVALFNNKERLLHAKECDEQVA